MIEVDRSYATISRLILLCTLLSSGTALSRMKYTDFLEGESPEAEEIGEEN